MLGLLGTSAFVGGIVAAATAVIRKHSLYCRSFITALINNEGSTVHGTWLFWPHMQMDDLITWTVINKTISGPK